MHSIRESKQGFCIVDDVYVKWHLGDPCLPLVFTFAGAENNDPQSTLSKKDAMRGANPWAFQTIKSMGCNVISFASVDKPCWYRSVALHSFMHEVNLATCDYANRLGYGVSMGGFGASAFSNVLNIKRLLLFYPIPTKNTLIAPFIGKSEDAVLRYDWNYGFNDGATSLASGVIFYDPFYKRDALGIKRFNSSFQRIRCSGLEHGFAGKFVPSGLLKTILSGFIEGNLDVHSIRRSIRDISRCFESYYQNISSKSRSSLVAGKLNFCRAGIRETVQGKKLAGIQALLSIEKDAQAMTLTSVMGMPLGAVYIFRDAAIESESVDMVRSFKLMTFAKKIKSNGPVINKKILFYKDTPLIKGLLSNG